MEFYTVVFPWDRKICGLKEKYLTISRQYPGSIVAGQDADA